MSQDFFDSKEYSEIKIFQIDKSFYELKSFESDEIRINHIIKHHQDAVEISKTQGNSTTKANIDSVTYYSYVYNETIKDSYWASYLPSAITEGHNFQVLRLSFVLFAVVEDNIFAIVGGGGIRVLKRYLNHRFGLEFFEYLTIPNEDQVVSMTSRGISGSLTSQSEIYRNGRTLTDCLSFTKIPTKINITLRKDLIDTVFDFIDFNNETIYAEIGSYFYIKHRITFHSLHDLLKRINEIIRDHQPTPLSTFNKVHDPILKEKEFKSILLQNLLDDMFDKFGPGRVPNPYKFDIDFVHPSKLQDFYECDNYILKAKGAKFPFFETDNHAELYSEGLRFLFNNLEHPDNLFEFSTALLGMHVIGYRDSKVSTHAMFIQHITCEIKHNNKPYFQIDNNWYKVKDDFIESINERCINLLEKNYLSPSILKRPWIKDNQVESEYNLSYIDDKNYFVFDTIVPNNIEFCDIMFIDETTIYLIHVKDGFDAKMRDVSNQIVISANRVWNDISSGSQSYLESVIDLYNNKHSSQIDKGSILADFQGKKEIVYVLVFRSQNGDLPVKNRIANSKSNIAKYSLIQCMQDMSSLYRLKIFDVSDIETTVA